MKYILFLISIITILSCKSQPKTQVTPLLQLSKEHQVIFLDSVQAGTAITIDEKENFFNLINKLDMSIQMKKNFAAETSREDAVKEYKAFLKTDVLAFSKEDMEFINEVFKEAYELCNKVSTNIFPKEIKLIKSHGTHYGFGAYYTRENCIIIPKDVLELKNHKSFLETMLHEISHIYTRYNPEQRKAIYKLIGFTSIGNQSNLLMKDGLRERVLLNPDGINFAYTIDLKELSGQPYSAIPVIISNETEFLSTKSNFFNYIFFSLYKVRMNHSARVISDEEGNSTVNMNNIPDFFSQITDNTGYIIHPDEIVADNFMYIMMREKKDGLNRTFSEKGIELLKNMKNILAES